jgi:hypothetical protein
MWFLFTGSLHWGFLNMPLRQKRKMVSSAAVLWHVERISHIPEDTFSTIIPLT